MLAMWQDPKLVRKVRAEPYTRWGVRYSVVLDRVVKTEPLSVRGLPATVSGGMFGWFPVWHHLTSFTERAPIIESSQSQAQRDADDAAPRYVINIAYPPTGEEAPFTTRGTYRVKKVLAGACKSFGLDFERYDFCALSWLLFRIFF